LLGEPIKGPAEQKVGFCTAPDGSKIAYAVTGKGPPLVRAAHYLSHLEFDFESPVWRHWIRELSRYNTYIRYDERGCGLSDQDPPEFSFDAWVSDLETVVDSLGLQKFDLLGVSQGGAVAISYAAKHPERINRLVLYGAYARGWGKRVGPGSQESAIETRETMGKLIELGWGQDNPAFRQVFTSLFVPEGGLDEQRWFNELQRVSCSPRNALRFDEVFKEIDVVSLVSKVNVPTLIMHARHDGVVPLEEGRLLASQIPDARFVSFEGKNHILLESEPGWNTFLREFRSFIGAPSGDVSQESHEEREVTLPLLEQILPGGLRYGANYLVEFEPQSLWFEASLTLCAQALRQGIRTDYHTFTHPPEDIRRHLGQMGLDLPKLEADDTFRIWDSYSVQTGLVTPSGGAGGIQRMDSSVNMKDWDAGSISAIKGEVSEADKRRLHVDDNTSILVQFNDEKSVSEHFRTLTVPFVRRVEFAAIHSVAAGMFSDGFYRQFESFCDGVIDFRTKEEEEQIGHYMRLRFARGATHDSGWKRIGLVVDGEVEIVHGGSKGRTSEHGEKGGRSEAVEFLAGHDELDLAKYSVVGSYLRTDEPTRNLLKDLLQKIVASFDSASQKHGNFLVWAPPGSGKTSFVRQVASSLGNAVGFSEVNLAETSERDFRNSLAGAGSSAGPTLLFIDEVDSRSGESWPFEALLAALDSEKGESRRVFVLAGSLGRSLQEMKEEIAARTKGQDVLSRIPAGSEYSMPGMTELDNVLVFLSALGESAPRLGKRVEEIEKFGLYYVATSPQLANARRIREFSIRCAERIPRGEGRLKYDNMFDAGDPANKEFWVSQSNRVPKLVNSFLRVKRQGGLEEVEGERRLAAIMFTDTVGFTAMAQRDEEQAMELLRVQRGLMRPLFEKYRGREVKTIGDAFLVEFASALEAVKCAVGIQDALKESNSKRSEEKKILVRIGIHLGDVIHSGTDVAGDAVNVASRLEPLAPSGGVCVSGQVYESVVNKVQYRFESLGRPWLKNVSTQIEVYRLAGYGQEVTPSTQEAGPVKNRIAVLPFKNISPDPADEYFADGMTEELISAISKVGGLRVIARTSVMRYKGKDKPAGEIARELGVRSLLEGSVRKQGSRTRITVQLVDASSEEERWSQEYDRDIQDIFAIQEDIGRKVSDALKVHVLRDELKAVGREGTQKPEAYVQYLRGRQHWNRRTRIDLEEAIKRFEEALRIDPRYAKAYSGIADSYAMLTSYATEYLPPLVAYPQALVAVQKALELDPDLVEAHTSLGVLKLHFGWDCSGAEKEFTRSIELGPSYAPAHQFYSDHLKAMGRLEEALREVRRAQELDPLSLPINSAVGHVLYLSKRYDEAIEQYKKVVELDPSFMMTHIWFGRPLLEKGMFEDALVELQTGVRLSGESNVALGMYGHGLASAGRSDEALEIVGKLKERSKTEYVSSYWIAAVYNGMKDSEETVSWLRKAFEERSSWLVWCNIEPRFDWLRGDSGFDALMSKMKFP
jgi:TolB-like protein/pimeloyl-ACP methyl ester carboxylesterase/KaiC/GvpD/RAD55 family RecA-like ATPase/Tfp pilus assembly protein PilF